MITYHIWTYNLAMSFCRCKQPSSRRVGVDEKNVDFHFTGLVHLFHKKAWEWDKPDFQSFGRWTIWWERREEEEWQNTCSTHGVLSSSTSTVLSPSVEFANDVSIKIERSCFNQYWISVYSTQAEEFVSVSIEFSFIQSWLKGALLEWSQCSVSSISIE